jgi:hypothetical protein
MEPVDYMSLSPSERRLMRDRYVIHQGDRCHYCKNFLHEAPTEDVLRKKINMKLFPRGFLDHPVHLHHHHTTGLTIGAVHARCNAVLWQYHGE